MTKYNKVCQSQQIIYRYNLYIRRLKHCLKLTIPKVIFRFYCSDKRHNYIINNNDTF